MTAPVQPPFVIWEGLAVGREVDVATHGTGVVQSIGAPIPAGDGTTFRWVTVRLAGEIDRYGASWSAGTITVTDDRVSLAGGAS